MKRRHTRATPAGISRSRSRLTKRERAVVLYFLRTGAAVRVVAESMERFWLSLERLRNELMRTYQIPAALLEPIDVRRVPHVPADFAADIAREIEREHG